MRQLISPLYVFEKVQKVSGTSSNSGGFLCFVERGMLETGFASWVARKASHLASDKNQKHLVQPSTECFSNENAFRFRNIQGHHSVWAPQVVVAISDKKSMMVLGGAPNQRVQLKLIRVPEQQQLNARVYIKHFKPYLQWIRGTPQRLLHFL